MSAVGQIPVLPEPAEHLEEAGRELWRELTAGAVLDPGDRPRLLAACEICDTMAALRRTYLDEAPDRLDSSGRPHAAVTTASRPRCCASCSPRSRCGKTSPGRGGSTAA